MNFMNYQRIEVTEQTATLKSKETGEHSQDQLIQSKSCWSHKLAEPLK